MDFPWTQSLYITNRDVHRPDTDKQESTDSFFSYGDGQLNEHLTMTPRPLSDG